MKQIIADIFLALFAISLIAFLDYVAIQHNIDGIALTTTVGSITAIVSWVIRGHKESRHKEKRKHEKFLEDN